MIISGKSRQNGNQLGTYVMSKAKNETVNVLEVRGATTQDPAAAIFEFSLQSEMTRRGKNGLYHASISPEIGEDAKFTAADWLRCADVLEKKLNLTNQPRALVWHEKTGKDGQIRKHLHCVWQREKEGKLVKMSHNYRQHDSARRDLEVEFKHKLTRQPRLVKEQLTKIWETVKDGRDFLSKAKEAGYMVAKSARRAYTLIDQRGEKMDLVRQIIGVRTRDVEAKLQPLESEMKHEDQVNGWWKERKGRKAEARTRRQMEGQEAEIFAGEKKKDSVMQGDIRGNFEGIIDREKTRAEKATANFQEGKLETEFQRRRREAQQNLEDDNYLSHEL